MPFTSSPPSPQSPDPQSSSGTLGSPGQPVSRLRGAGAAVDARTAGRVVLALVLVTLAVLVVVFTVVGEHKNAQIDELRTQGVPVIVTVGSCIGLLGGSGSNAAGYACTGTYELGGHRYHEPLPGNGYHARGATVAAVAVPGDPTLVSTAAIVRSDHASARVYILPAVLFAVLVAVLAVLVVRQRRRRSRAAATPT
jgi:uncharacterized membrane protein YfcA